MSVFTRSRIVWAIFFSFVILVTTTARNPMNSGIPFNLPDFRYCTSCKLEEGVRNSPVNSELDVLCKTYIEDVLKEKILDYPQSRLVESVLHGEQKNYSFIFFSWVKSRHLYEEIFEKPYSLRLHVDASCQENDAYCIQAYHEGDGFITSVPKPDKPKYMEGKRFEEYYLKGVMDVWSILKCNSTFHTEFVQASKRRFEKMQNLSVTWNMYAPVTTNPYYGFPKYTNDTIIQCGDNPEKAQQSTRCNSLYCPIPKKSKLNDGSAASTCPRRSTESDISSQQSSRKTAADGERRDTTSAYYIHEFKSSRSGLNRTEFLEIRHLPHTEKDITYIHEHKVVIFTAQSLKLIVVINLERLEVSKEGYLVLNDKSFEKFQYAIDVDYEFNVLPFAVNEPMVILLLKRKEPVITKLWSAIKLRGRKSRRGNASVDLTKSVPVAKGETTDLLQLFQLTVVDGYAYGAIVNTAVSTRIKEMLRVEPNNCNFILSPGTPARADEDNLSLNSCPTQRVSHFDYKSFKLGPETPWSENDCSLSYTFQTDRFEDDSSVDNAVGITHSANTAEECPMDDAKLGRIDRLIEYELELIRKFNSSYVNEYYPISKFADETWLKLRASNFDPTHPDFPDIGPYKIIESITPSYIWRCEVCHERFTKEPGSFHRGSPSDLATGVSLPTNSRDRAYTLKRHVREITHHASVLRSLREERSATYINRRLQYATSPNPDLETTANQLLVTYTLIKTNTALLNAGTWFTTIERMKTKFGRQYQRYTATYMVHFIATTGHSNLLSYMVKNKTPFACILDSSSDSKNHHYILLYLSALEGEYTIPVLVGLISLGKSSTADSQLSAIQDWLAQQPEPFQIYFKEYITAYISDSAKVMIKLHRLISKWVDHKDYNGDYLPLIRILCLAHKLQLTTRSSLIPLKSDDDKGTNGSLLYFADLEKFIQSTHTWITIGQRRIGEFRDVLGEYNLPRVELRKLHTERWISSSHSTLNNFVTSWQASVITMDNIVNDETNYKVKLRDEAAQFLRKLVDKTKLIVIIFLKDYTSAFGKWSKKLQHFVGLMSDQEDALTELYVDLRSLEMFEGPALKQFLTQCKCSSSTNGECTIEDFEKSENVTWNFMTFYDNEPDSPQFTTLINDLMEKTKKKLNYYIPLEFVRACSVINPKRLPPSDKALELQRDDDENMLTEMPIYGKHEVEYLGKLLGMNTSSLLHDWGLLISSIVNLPSWDLIRTDLNTETFWARLLRDEKLKWTEVTRYFIRALKILAPGSTLCESGFSVFNVVKNQRRSSIADDTLFHILSMLINGPETAFFDHYGFAERWYLSGRQLRDKMEETEEEKAEVSDPGLNEIEDFRTVSEEDLGTEEDGNEKLADFLSQENSPPDLPISQQSLPRARSLAYSTM